MKVIIAGLHHGRPDQELKDAIACFHRDYNQPIDEVLASWGGGASIDADRVARLLDISLVLYSPAQHYAGKLAQMCAAADALICFDSGDGSGALIRQAKRAGLVIYIHPGATNET